MTTKQMMEPKASVKKKTTKKKTTKKKSVVKSVEGVLMPKDPIIDTAAEVENLKQTEALAMVPQLIEATEFNYFKLGGVLAVIQENQFWDEELYDNFKEFIEKETGLPYRKSLYLIDIYHNLVSSGVKWDQVKSVGWTKLKEISDVITQKNVDGWVSKAEEMTTLQLIEHLNDDGTPVKKGEVESTPITTLTVKVHEDQKETIREAMEKAKADSKSEYDSVALEYIAMAYLEGSLGKPKTKKAPSLNAQMKKMGADTVLEHFEQVFPDINITVEI